MLIARVIKNRLLQALDEDKIIVLYGPRQTGKTTLLNQLESEIKKPVLRVDADLKMNQDVFSSQDLEKLKTTVGNCQVLMIDEAQRIENIGVNLKIIHDNLKNVKVMATGSSSFELANKIREPLTGRAITFRLYPLSLLELSRTHTNLKLKQMLENFLIFGMYPEVITLEGGRKKIRYLKEFVEANLYKDILELEAVKSPKLLKDLLTMLAFQIGKEVSLSELSRGLGVALETVKRYLDLLEKAFIISRIGGFSRNLRKEVIKNSRYYFIDVGVRNTLINNFNSISLRDDVGMLWENFVIMERIKLQEYKEVFVNNYFWRTYDQKEIDLVEERGGRLSGFEMKWTAHKAKSPAEFLATYKGSTFQVINKDNFLDFLL